MAQPISFTERPDRRHYTKMIGLEGVGWLDLEGVVNRLYVDPSLLLVTQSNPPIGPIARVAKFWEYFNYVTELNHGLLSPRRV